MQDGLQKGNIDLDELVNTLLKEKESTKADPAAEPLASPAVNEPTTSFAETADVLGEEEEPETTSPEQPPVEADAETWDELTTEAQTPISSAPADEEDEPPAVPKKDKKKRGPSLREKLRDFFKPEDDAEDVTDEEWADFKPIGHLHEDTVIKTDEQPAVLQPSESAPVEDISSGRETAVEPNKHPDEAASAVTTVEPATMVMPAVRPNTPMVDDATRVVDVRAQASSAAIPQAVSAAQEAPASAEEEPQPQLPDQLSLEELVRVEDVEGDTDDESMEIEEDAVARFQRTREEKVKEFVLSGDEEEENEPEEEAHESVEEEDQEIEDFTGYDTTQAVLAELQYRKRTGLISLLLTAGLELVLVLLSLITLMLGQSPITSIGYLTAQVFCLILIAVLNYPVISHGLSGMFMLKANNDTAPAMATAFALCGLILHFLDQEASLPMFAPMAGLLMLLNAAAQSVKVSRIRENFSFVSYVGAKYAASYIEEEKAAMELGRRVSAEEPADVAYFRRASFLSSYLTNAYEEDDGDRYAKWGAPIAMVLSLLLSLGLWALDMFDGFWPWLSAFVFMLCLSAFTLSFAMQVPMKDACRRMLSKGGFLVGWNAVDAFGQPQALAVDVSDLYPDESMLLHGIKTFSGVHIDEAILDAASLSIRAGGPLSMIFRRIIQNKEELLHEVDSLVYEQGMGLSGWVDGRRVLVGNRRLLQNHSVDVPSMDYEARYAKNGRRLVYLSTAGELSAMFVVSYLPDETIGDALRRLCRARVTLLVRSNDSNITAESLCRDFELDEYYVDVLSALACRMYDQLVAEEQESLPASVASNGHILGTAKVLAACRGLRVKSRIVLALQILLSACGLLVGAVSVLNPIASFGYMLLTAALLWIAPLFKRI